MNRRANRRAGRRPKDNMIIKPTRPLPPCGDSYPPVKGISEGAAGGGGVQPHYHTDERGLLVRCYHESKSLLANWRFWAGLTFGFPVEHALYEHVWPFTLVTHWMGL